MPSLSFSTNSLDSDMGGVAEGGENNIHTVFTGDKNVIFK